MHWQHEFGQKEKVKSILSGSCICADWYVCQHMQEPQGSSCMAATVSGIYADDRHQRMIREQMTIICARVLLVYWGYCFACTVATNKLLPALCSQYAESRELALFLQLCSSDIAGGSAWLSRMKARRASGKSHCERFGYECRIVYVGPVARQVALCS